MKRQPYATTTSERLAVEHKLVEREYEAVKALEFAITTANDAFEHSLLVLERFRATVKRYEDDLRIRERARWN